MSYLSQKITIILKTISNKNKICNANKHNMIENISTEQINIENNDLFTKLWEPKMKSSWQGIAWNHENNSCFPIQDAHRPYFQNNVTKLAEDNFLIRLFIDKIKQYDGKGGIEGIGKAYTYLRDGIPGGINSEYVMNAISHRGGVLMNQFYEMSAGIATVYSSVHVNMDLHIHPEFVFGLPLNELLTSEYVINTQYQFMDAWLTDRLQDLTGIEKTSRHWSREETKFIKESYETCYKLRDQIQIEKSQILNRIRELGIANYPFQGHKEGPVKPILKEIFEEYPYVRRYSLFPYMRPEEGLSK